MNSPDYFKKKLNVKKFLNELYEITTMTWDQIRDYINQCFGEKLPFKEDKIVHSRLFALILSFQIQSMRNISTINHEQIEEDIFRYLSDLNFTDQIRHEIESYARIFEKEIKNNLQPLSGVALSFLIRTVGKKSLDAILDKHTFKNGEINPFLLSGLCGAFTALVASSTVAREMCIAQTES